MRIWLLLSLGLIGLWQGTRQELSADDWPTYRHDQSRSGVSLESLDARKLVEVWRQQLSLPPSPAWPDSARWDAYAGLDGLRSMRNYDPVFHPVVVAERLFLPGNADDTVKCFELETGRLLWRYTAEGPVRIAPTVYDDRVLFGSDDGCVYALAADTGHLIWQTRIAEDAGWFLNDGRMISRMPVRSGVLIDPDDKTAVVSAGLFPWNATLLVGLDLATGAARWTKDLGAGWTIEGAMLLAPNHVIAPQGRAAPQLFERHTGQPAGALAGGGGSFVILTDDEQIFHGPGNKGGWITTSKADTREKVATFDKGTAVVVKGDVAYLLDEQKLAAFQRSSGTVLWTIPCRCPHELILAGTTLYAGGDDLVMAFDSTTGGTLWRGEVTGRAAGLAVAQGHLIVSTDTGTVHAFAPVGPPAEPAELDNETRQGEGLVNGTAPPPAAEDDASLIDRWVFHAEQLTENESEQALEGPSLSVRSLVDEGRRAPLPHGTRLVQAGSEHALKLDGVTESQIADDYANVPYPVKELTVEAWVRIDKPIEWGGLLSMTQDNGSFEKGWILGYRQNRFGFALNGEQGPDKLTWVVDNTQTFVPKSWHHVAGTYDGETIRLYVDGGLVAESKEQAGKIQYPPRAAYHLGAYKDDDEHYIAEGMLNEMRLYGRALSTLEIAQHAEEKSDRFPVVEAVAAEPPGVPPWRGPFLKFIAPGQAEVVWWTQTEIPSHLELVGSDGEVLRTIESATPATRHRVTFGGLRRDEIVRYRIVQLPELINSPIYECDSHFDYSRPKLNEATPDPEASQQALAVLAAAAIQPQRGIAVVWGADDEGRLGEALCREAGLDVIVLDDDAESIQRARERLLDNGVYGRGVSVRAVASGDASTWVRDFADLLVVPRSAGQPSIDGAAVLKFCRMLRPGGKAVFLDSQWQQLDVAGAAEIVRDNQPESGWLVVRRQVPAGAAPWTHMYGTPGNSAYAGETLAGVSRRDQLQVAWAGRPGPRYQSDRGNRKPSPLAAGGRLYMQGLHRIISVNAHNGTILWSLELPEVIRFNVPRDCSNWCADDGHVFVAANQRCLRIDGQTGEVLDQWEVYSPDQRQFDWGYVARYDDLLLGSGVQADAPFRSFWGGEHWYDAKDGELAKKVCSDVLFGKGAERGDLRWSYVGGLIVNPTITIEEGRIHFVECRSAELIADKARRLDGDEFWKNLHLVTLDARTGRKIWEVPARPMPGESAMYLVAAEGKLVLQTSQGGSFAVYTLDAATGEQVWRGKYDWETNHHGKHLSRPAVVEGRIYLRPLTLDLQDGSVLAQAFPAGHQCGTYTASRNALFLRAGSLAVWDRETGDATRWDRARPDCWISTIPALGMLLSPEGGGGCSCGGWIETSMGFAPVRESP